MDNDELTRRWLSIDEPGAAEAQALRMVICDMEGHDNAKAFISMGITSAMFLGIHAKLLWSSVENLLEQGRKLGTQTIAQEAGAGSDKSMMDYILDLYPADYPLPEYIDFIALHLIDLANQRRVGDIGKSIEELDRDESTWAEKKTKLTEFNREIAELTKPALEKDEDPFDVIDEEFDARDKGEKPANSKPIYTGMPALDHWLRPLDIATADYYTLIFGVSGNGKSALGHMMFADSLRKGYRCAAFLGEVTADQMIKSIASQSCKLDLLNYEMETKHKQAEFRGVIGKIRELWQDKMFIYDDQFIIEDIIRRCRDIQKTHGKLDMVLIDHLHQLKTMKAFKDERLRYNYMSGLMKPLSMELKCPVIVLAQPSRGLKTENRPPKISDLKETGSLEDDADRIWGIFIPDKDGNGVDQFGSLEPEGTIVQLKFKKGHQGSAKVRFHKKYTLFADEE